MAPSVRFFSPLLTLVLIGGLSGCTDERAEPPPPPADTNAQQVRAGLAALWTGDNPTTEDTTAADCFAQEFLSRTGTEGLRQGGLIDAGGAVVTALPVLDERLAGHWVDAQFECVDFVEETTRAVAAQSRGAVDQSVFAACLEESLSAEQIRAALVAGLSGDPDATALDILTQAQSDCAIAAA